MRYLKYILVVAASLALFACGGDGGTGTGILIGTGVISLNGGNGGSGVGETAGSIASYKNLSSVHGDLKFHATGTVDASFAVPTITPSFGANPVTIAADTVVGSTASTTPGQYYVVAGDNNLYLVGSTGTAAPVTGLTVNAGRKLSIPNTNGSTLIPGGVVINGNVASVSAGEPVDLRSGSLLQVGSSGTVTSQPAAAGTTNGQITLVSGGVLINLGTVDSSGSAGSGTSAGGIRLEAGTFLFNTNKVSAKGDGAGSGGPIQLVADSASLYTSGAIDASGGAGTTGGFGGSISLSGGGAGVGRMTVQGTVTSNGGGSAGNGGNGGAIDLNSFAGSILINATISAVGGQGSINGGSGGSLQLSNKLGSDAANQHQLSPEGIKVTGNLSLNGGVGGAQGGNGGTFSFSSVFTDNALAGFANVEFFGYQSITLLGGNSASGSGGNGGNLMCGLTSSDSILGINLPPGAIINEVAISAKGGDNTNSPIKSVGSTGGQGGTIHFTTPQNNGSGDPTRTILTNSATIDVSGGAAATGGGQGSVTMASFGNLTNSGAIIAVGGTGVTLGGGIPAVADPNTIPFLVMLSSTNSLINSGSINVAGGSGATGGNAGGISLASGNQTTNSAAIIASGGASTASPATNGGNGGKISLSSELAFIVNSVFGSLNVARGSGGGSNTGITGIILFGGVNITA